MNSSAPLAATPAISRREHLFLTGAILIGAFVRLNFLGRIAVEHFDEAVYASNFWFDASEGYSYPARYLYAPPLLPAMIEWTMTLVSILGFKPTGFIPMIPSLIAGIAMIPSIWWIGRRWFGPSAGLVSAWLVATSDFHASYSRTALTDVMLSLFVLWAVYFFWCGWVIDPPAVLERSKSKTSRSVPLPWRYLMMAGLFTGLAWSTKYNGWLPLAIAAAGSGLWVVIVPSSERAIPRTFTRWGIVVVIAFLVWSPVLNGLQQFGGYAAVAANHRQYVVGLNQWWRTAATQIRCIGMYDNLMGMVIEPALVSTSSRQELPTTATKPGDDVGEEATARTETNTAKGHNSAAATLPIVDRVVIPVNRFFVFAVPIIMLFAAATAAFAGLASRFDRRHRIAACLLAAWLIGMSFATPFYHPYPRLVLPWLTAIWLGIGLAVQLQPWRCAIKSAETASTDRPLGRFEFVLILWLASNCLVRLVAGAAHAWSDRTEMAVISERLASRISNSVGSSRTAESGSIVFVWGEPSLVFGMRSHGFKYAIPSQGPASIGKNSPAPTFLIFGKQSAASGEYRQSQSQLEQYSLKEICRFESSHLVEMDSQEISNFYSRASRDVVSEADRQSHDPTSDAATSQIWLYRTDAK